MNQDRDPRTDSTCLKCGPGTYDYDGQSKNSRGQPVSVYVCDQCGHEVLVR